LEFVVVVNAKQMRFSLIVLVLQLNTVAKLSTCGVWYTVWSCLMGFFELLSVRKLIYANTLYHLVTVLVHSSAFYCLFAHHCRSDMRVSCVSIVSYRL